MIVLGDCNIFVMYVDKVLYPIGMISLILTDNITVQGIYS